MLLSIDSRYRDSNSNSIDDFYYTVKISKDINHVKLLSLSVPLSMSTFATGFSTVSFIEAATSGTTRTATITPGNYNDTTFTTELATRLNAAGTQVYTVSISSSRLLTISASAAFTLLFSISSSPYYRLGFPNSNTSSATSQTSTNALNLSPTGEYYLLVDGFGFPNVRLGSNQSFASTWPIWLSGDSNSFSYWTNNTYPELKCDTIPGQLHISLRSADGKLSGILSDWNIILSLR